jgi:hypothetical protein
MLDQLQAMGCHYEGFNKKYFAVSIPLQVSMDDVTQLLTRTGLQWECANPANDDLAADLQQGRPVRRPGVSLKN